MTAVADATAPAATAPASEPAAITVEGLTASIRIAGRWFDAVRDVSFEVRRQETLALVGESGCGKSLTALSIMGLLPAGIGRISAGRIVVDALDMTAADEAGKAKVLNDLSARGLAPCNDFVNDLAFMLMLDAQVKAAGKRSPRRWGELVCSRTTGRPGRQRSR